MKKEESKSKSVPVKIALYAQKAYASTKNAEPKAQKPPQSQIAPTSGWEGRGK